VAAVAKKGSGFQSEVCSGISSHYH